jgi:vacuolar iron transporter family protein
MSSVTAHQNGVLPQDEMYHRLRDPHHRGSSLAEIILGGQDGLVNVLGVILGVAAASGDARIVVAAGLAAAFAESISMGAVAYTSTLANADLYESERAREYRHLEAVPQLERKEIVEIYRQKGFDGELLNRIVDTITANKDVWVAVMMSEEHGLVPADRREALRAALVVGFSAIVGSFIPLLPFFFLPVSFSIILSTLTAAITLFSFGMYKARITVGHPVRSGVELAVIGIVSALAGYVVGLLFQVPSGTTF